MSSQTSNDFSNIMELLKPEDENQRDKLTDCLIRDVFSKDFDKFAESADKKNEDLTLIMLDIDNFLHVNTDFGHKTGDDVLIEISKVLLDIPAEHHTYRYSGDCFAMLFPNCEKERAFLIMEEARKKIAESPECQRTNTTVSAGVATYPEDGTRESDIFRKADGALFRAKTSGRNKVALAKEDKLVAKTAHYTVEQLKKLENLAENEKISEAALMREALDELLKKYSK
jgi:diguanylate cyclase (GGDEF)-like protein